MKFLIFLYFIFTFGLVQSRHSFSNKNFSESFRFVLGGREGGLDSESLDRDFPHVWGEEGSKTRSV